MPLSYQQVTGVTVEPVSVALAKQHLRVYFDQDDAYIGQLITAARQYVEKHTNRAIFNRQMLLTLDYFPWPGWDSTTGSTAHDYFMHWYYRGLTIRLPMPATVSVQSIMYLATDGVTTMTIDPQNYIVDTVSEPARIAPRPGYTWPYQQNYVPGQVHVNYTAGSYEVPGTLLPFAVPASGIFVLPASSNFISVTGVENIEGQSIPYMYAPGQITVPPTLAGQTLAIMGTISNCPQPICWAILLLVSHWYYHRDAVSAEPLKNVPLAVNELLAPYICESFSW